MFHINFQCSWRGNFTLGDLLQISEQRSVILAVNIPVSLPYRTTAYLCINALAYRALLILARIAFVNLSFSFPQSRTRQFLDVVLRSLVSSNVSITKQSRIKPYKYTCATWLTLCVSRRRTRRPPRQCWVSLWMSSSISLQILLFRFAWPLLRWIYIQSHDIDKKCHCYSMVVNEIKGLYFSKILIQRKPLESS